jgi:hypothetical protein
MITSPECRRIFKIGGLGGRLDVLMNPRCVVTRITCWSSRSAGHTAIPVADRASLREVNLRLSLLAPFWVLAIITKRKATLWITSVSYQNRAVIAQSVWRLDYGLDDRGSRVRFPAGAWNFSLHHRVQNGSGVHPASYPMGTRALSLGVKRPGRDADHSPPSIAEVKVCVELYLHSPLRLHSVVLS